MDQSVYDSMDFLPFGEQIAGGWGTTHKFTGYERDWETDTTGTVGNDYAFARYYASRAGRFMSPDPLGGDIGDPQSLNLYAYVLNNPINFVDPTGQECTTGPDGIIRCTATGQADPDFGPSPIGVWDHPGHDDKYNWRDGRPPKPVGRPHPGRTPRTPLEAVALGTRMAEPGVNLAATLLRAFGWLVSAGLMAGAECVAAGSDCRAGDVALAMLPPVAKLREGAMLLKGGAVLGKGAEILQKSGGVAQTAKDFATLGGVEKVSGATRIRTLSDGTKAVLYNSTSGGGPTIALQDRAGRTLTKIRY